MITKDFSKKVYNKTYYCNIYILLINFKNLFPKIIIKKHLYLMKKYEQTSKICFRQMCETKHFCVIIKLL